MNCPFLLDTCAALWIMDRTIKPQTLAALNHAHQSGLPTYLSPISAWEVGMLARVGRFRSHLSPERWFEGLMSAPGMTLSPMPPELLMASSALPAFTRKDPADRIIAATAREYGYAVVTRDAALLDYGKQGYLDVLEC